MLTITLNSESGVNTLGYINHYKPIHGSCLLGIRYKIFVKLQENEENSVSGQIFCLYQSIRDEKHLLVSFLYTNPCFMLMTRVANNYRSFLRVHFVFLPQPAS